METKTCKTCDLTECICPKGIKEWPGEEQAYYKGADGEKHYWPKIGLNEAGKVILGCRLCGTYNAGVKFAGRNAIARFKYLVTDSTSTSTIKEHIQRGPDGDHGKCYTNFLQVQAASGKSAAMIADGQSVIADCVKARADMKPGVELMNMFSWLYVALVLPASAKQFHAMMHTAQGTGSKILEDQYQGDYFFKHGMEAFNTVLIDHIVTAFSLARKVSWHIGIGGGALLIRVYLLNARFERVSHFWQGRRIATHTAEGIFRSFLNSLETASAACAGRQTVGMVDIWKKTCLFLADGASVNGVRQKGKAVHTAVAGDNVFHKLQQKSDDVLVEAGYAKAPPIIGYWCDNHQTDIVAQRPEKQISYVASLMHFFRSLISHIMQSDRAQGILDYISLMVSAAEEADVQSGEGVAGGSGGSLSRVWFAP